MNVVKSMIQLIQVKTGDDTPLLALEIASTMSIIAGAIIVIKTKKKEN